MAYESLECPICGHKVEQSGKGRPKVYHDKCRKLEQLFSWSEDLLMEIFPTAEAKKKIRGRFWYLANQINKKNKG